MPNQVARTFKLALLLMLSHLAGAEVLDKKLQVIPQLESAFNPQTAVVTTINNRSWRQAGISLSINNQWQLSMSSKQPITVNRISLSLNNVKVANQVNLVLDATHPANYLLTPSVIPLPNKYKLLGIVQQLNADTYVGYQNYMGSLLKVTLDWHDATSYNEASTNFLIVYAK